VTFESGILFAFDSDQILPTAGTNLTELAKSLQRYPDSQLLIVGHTDGKGDDAYNQRLSERRSASAAAYLASQGVDRARLSATGKGESEPIATNDTDAGQAKNRRVEVAIFASEAYRQRLLRSNTGD
jgi:outer membrane protein OmpA-like peptidoglycan-associated protein